MALTVAETRAVLPLVRDAIADGALWGIAADLVNDTAPDLAGRLRLDVWLPDVMQLLGYGDYIAHAVLFRVRGIIQVVASEVCGCRTRAYPFTRSDEEYRAEIMREVQELGTGNADFERYMTGGRNVVVLRYLTHRKHVISWLYRALRGEQTAVDVANASTRIESRAWPEIVAGGY